MDAKLKMAVLLGSTREGRFCDTVAGWAARRITADGGFEVDVVDPAALDLPARHQRADGQTLAALGRRLDQADAFVVVTPEYNHSYPAVLKFLIDSFGREWQAKPVAFVSYGGVSGGLRAVEHLRGVFAELHAVGIRDTVSFAGVWSRFGPDGELRDPEEAERAVAVMLKRLRWWAAALRDARAVEAYGDAA